jgi:LysR family glycine cleavage system transcriptional activator
MRDLRSSTSGFAELIAFEAAARLGSFTKAADALDVSQPAVSLRVRALEKRLSTSLFAREGRGVSLTADGLRLWQELKAGFDRIAEAVAAVERKAARHDTVTIVVSSAFASYWLLPRIRKFQAKNPAVELRVMTSDRGVDLASERIPLAVRHGDGAWTDHKAWPIAREAVFPVCSPRYLKRHGSITSPGDLIKHQLIDFHERHRRHVTWEDWFREAEVRTRRRFNLLEFNDYALVLKAALSGEGIALGWEHLVGDLLAEGHLVAPKMPIVSTGMSYWLIAPADMPETSGVVHLRDWLLAEAKTITQRTA